MKLRIRQAFVVISFVLCWGIPSFSLAATGSARLGRIVELAHSGQFNTVIAQTTQDYNEYKSGKGASPEILYLRAYAEWGIGLFDEAETDLSFIRNYNVTFSGRNILSSQDCRAKIKEAKALRPPLLRQVTDAEGRVTFSVYSNESNPWVQNVITLLPTAYKVNKSMFGVDVYNTPVFIFSDRTKYTAFWRVCNEGISPGSWNWGGGGPKGIYLCQIGPYGSLVQNTEFDPHKLASTITHEYNHVVTRRYYNAFDLPLWFTEGLGNYVGSEVSPKDLIWDGMKVYRLFSNKKVLALKELNYDSYDSMYAQATSMVLYLMSNQSRKSKLPKLLMLVSQSGNFEKSFQEAYEISVQQFYDEWYKRTLEDVSSLQQGK